VTQHVSAAPCSGLLVVTNHNTITASSCVQIASCFRSHCTCSTLSQSVPLDLQARVTARSVFLTVLLLCVRSAGTAITRAEDTATVVRQVWTRVTWQYTVSDENFPKKFKSENFPFFIMTVDMVSLFTFYTVIIMLIYTSPFILIAR
jgi:hypothetical protein